MEGVKGITVRNLRRSDIEEVSNYDYTKYKHNPDSWQEVTSNDDSEDLIYYGQKKTYNTNFQSPAMWSNHDNTWTYKYDSTSKKGTGDPDCNNPWEQEYGSETETGNGNTTKDTEFAQSYYAHNYKGKENEFKNSKYYDMIFTDENGSPVSKYWLACRYVHFYDTFCKFGLNSVSVSDEDCLIFGESVFFSDRQYL